MGFIGAPRGAALSTIRPRVWRTDEAVSRSEEWLNARYLRLDTTNDPLTDTLETRMLKASAANLYDIGEAGTPYRNLTLSGNADMKSASTNEDWFYFTGNSGSGVTGFYVIEGGGGDAYFGISIDEDFTKWIDMQTNIGGNKAIIATNFPYIEMRAEVRVPHILRGLGVHPYGPNDDLGRTGAHYKWRDLYLTRNLTDDTNSVTVANLKAAYDHEQTTHDYAFISGNDAGTNVTAAELEELTDTSETVLHSHAGLTTDEKVKVDAAATAGYLGIASNDGVLRASAPLSYADGGDFVTLGITQSDTDTDGYLSQTDWDTFNEKSDLALGELSTDAYRGDRGKTAYDHSQVTHDYSYISGNDGATDVTAAQLEELTDASETTLHSHASDNTDKLVGVDAAATPDYLGIAFNDGVLRASAPLAYADGGNFITLSITQADTDTDGYLSQTDWDTFNGKSDLALGATSTTAYRGDRGTTAYDHSQVTHDYAYITGNDGATGITAAELEELSDGSTTTLHAHAGGGSHNILDGSVHPDSVADTVTRGSLIYGNATPKWDELVIGGASEFLKSDGTDAAWGAHGLTYADIKRTSCVLYMDLIVADDDGMLTVRGWQDETVTVFARQPDVPRQITSLCQNMDLGNNMTGTITVNGIDADGAVIDEVLTVSIPAMGAPQIYTTDQAFALVTSIVTNQTGSASGLYQIGWNDTYGLPNYPFNATSDIFKIKRNAANDAVAGWTINATYGTIKSGLSMFAGDDITVWYRPYK